MFIIYFQYPSAAPISNSPREQGNVMAVINSGVLCHPLKSYLFQRPPPPPRVHSIYSQHGISVKCLLWNSLWVTRLSVKCTGAHMSGILGKVLFSISPSHSSHFSISTHDHGPKQGRICVLGTMSDKLSKFCAQKVWFCLLKS